MIRRVVQFHDWVFDGSPLRIYAVLWGTVIAILIAGAGLGAILS